jgi:hypothetical protein
MLQTGRIPEATVASKIDVGEFIAFGGLHGPSELSGITRGHVIAWREDLEKRSLAASSVRRKI